MVARRGGEVSADPAVVGRVLRAVVLLVLAVSAIAFTAADVHHDQIVSGLRTDGVSVTVTVTSCLGELGGSGSNAAGYRCFGTYSVDGRSYHGTLPGSSLLGPGTQIRLLTLPGDPSLLAAGPGSSSWTVFLVPAALLAAFLGLLAQTVRPLKSRGRRSVTQLPSTCRSPASTSTTA
jgi:hypothetical protein